MTFNPDRSKEAQEIIFSRKLKKATHPPLLFNNNNVSQVNFQTHLGVILDVKLTFEEHLKNVFNKTKKYSCSGPPGFKSGSCRIRFS